MGAHCNQGSVQQIESRVAVRQPLWEKDLQNPVSAPEEALRKTADGGPGRVFQVFELCRGGPEVRPGSKVDEPAIGTIGETTNERWKARKETTRKHDPRRTSEQELSEAGADTASEDDACKGRQHWEAVRILLLSQTSTSDLSCVYGKTSGVFDHQSHANCCSVCAVSNQGRAAAVWRVMMGHVVRHHLVV